MNNRLAYALLSSLILLLLAGNLLWHNQHFSRYVFNRDEAIHFYEAVKMYDSVKSGVPAFFHNDNPLPSCFVTAAMLAFGKEGGLKYYILYVNMFFFAVFFEHNSLALKNLPRSELYLINGLYLQSFH